jgi:hypothetical protein
LKAEEPAQALGIVYATPAQLAELKPNERKAWELWLKARIGIPQFDDTHLGYPPASYMAPPRQETEWFQKMRRMVIVLEGSTRVSNGGKDINLADVLGIDASERKKYSYHLAEMAKTAAARRHWSTCAARWNACLAELKKLALAR